MSFSKVDEVVLPRLKYNKNNELIKQVLEFMLNKQNKTWFTVLTGN